MAWTYCSRLSNANIQLYIEGALVSWLTTLVGKVKLLAGIGEPVHQSLEPDSVWEASASSSAKSISLRSTVITCVYRNTKSFKKV